MQSLQEPPATPIDGVTPTMGSTDSGTYLSLTVPANTGMNPDGASFVTSTISKTTITGALAMHAQYAGQPYTPEYVVGSVNIVSTVPVSSVVWTITKGNGQCTDSSVTPLLNYYVASCLMHWVYVTSSSVNSGTGVYDSASAKAIVTLPDGTKSTYYFNESFHIHGPKN